jgi:hypothetical protein
MDVFSKKVLFISIQDKFRVNIKPLGKEGVTHRNISLLHVFHVA